ncbi:DNA mismatch repair protein MutS [Candidatus Entotheonellaceae bacterium PAL068K]
MEATTAESQPQLTPMMQQYAQAKAEHPDAIVLFRLGDFYEMFHADAHLGSRLLELVLTSREMGKGNRVPMCGVPVHAIESYIARLLEAGHKVAVCEQLEDARLARGLVRREVIRVLTPGTVVEEGMLDEVSHNFLVAIYAALDAYGLAALEVSTGEFVATTLDGDKALDALHNELARLQPSEWLVPQAWRQDQRCVSLQDSLQAPCQVCDDLAFDLERATHQLEHQLQSQDWQADGHTPLALRASGAVLHYLQATHKATLPHITELRRYRLSHYMALDALTRRNLELVRTMRQGERQGSVLGVLDETLTAMGARLLRRWLEQPLLQLEAINARHDAVAELVADAARRHHLRQALRQVYDIERLLSRLASNTGNARHLTALRHSLERLPQIRQALLDVDAGLLASLHQMCTGEEDVVSLIQQTIVDDPPSTIREGGLIRSGYDATLDHLMQVTERHQRWIARLQARERQRTGIKSLKVGYNQVFGYYIEVSKANLRLVPPDYSRKQTLTNAERFVTDRLKQREVAILQASERRVTLEYDVFVAIRERLAQQAPLLQRLAAAVAQLDALAALAEVAVVYDYTRPRLLTSGSIIVRQGRHPVVERRLDGFVPNDLRLDHEAHRLLLLTGPNMAGKSTYLRQVALITVLAQMGSFVPAAEATIGLVDRIFTRVGAIDDIAAGRSTFLVEMSETAHILHNATPRSLLILDEIGKGTSTSEGLSIAWAVALYIVRRLGTRALFATHYHELTALEGLCPGVHNLHMLVRQTPQGIVFLRQVAPGGTTKSYGLHVARLAGLPSEVLEEAAQVLECLERHNTGPVADSVPVTHGSRVSPLTDALLRQLVTLDLCQITPLQALSVLHALQQQARTPGRDRGTT